MASLAGAPPLIIPATIPNGQALSGTIDLRQAPLTGLLLPPAWTAAALTFAASVDGQNWFPLLDGTTERSYTVTVQRFMALVLSDWLGVPFLQLRSGTAAGPVNQLADRVFSLVGRP